MATLDEKLSRVENNIAASLEAAAEMGAEVPEGANSNNLPELIRSIPQGGSAEDCVKYTEQTLTEEQKAQARQNIGIEAAVLDILLSLDLAGALLDSDGAVLTGADGALLLI